MTANRFDYEEDKNSVFNTKQKPSLSFYDYIFRIMKYALVTEFHFLSATYYVEKLIRLTKMKLTHCNCYKLFLTAMVIAEKMLNDTYHPKIMYYFSQIGGISKSELLQLEQAFLEKIDFFVFIKRSEYAQYKIRVMEGTLPELEYIQKLESIK